jgi:ABC-type transporter MlaC component
LRNLVVSSAPRGRQSGLSLGTISGFVGAIACAFATPATARKPQLPVDVVEAFHECAQMTAQRKPCANDGEQLPGFLDLLSIANAIAGPRWPRASAAEQARFTAVLAQLIEKNMIERFGDRSVNVLAYRRLDNGDALVSGAFVARNDQMTRLTWLLRPRISQWLVADLSVDGLSLITSAREQLGLMIRSEDDGPLDQLSNLLRQRYHLH